MKIKIIQFLFIIVFVLGCMPEQAQRLRKATTEDSSVTDSETPVSDEDTVVTNDAYWYDNGQSGKTLTVDITNLKNGYILGDDVNIFLSKTEDFNATYCLQVNFVQGFGVSPKQLRAKLVPSITTNSSTGKVTRYFRANINSPTGNEACNIQSSESSVNGATITAPDLVNIANKVSDVCTNCSNIISSESVKVYKINTRNTISTLDDINILVDPTKFNYSNLVFRVDMNSNSSNNTPTCTNSQCQSLGYNCCVNGQCVNDAQLKMTRNEIQTNHPDWLNDFDLAEQLKLVNDKWYLNYPQFYYICLENVPNDDDDGELNPDDPVGDATKRLNEMITDYFCIEELKKYSESDPFHTDPISGSGSYSICSLNQPAVQNPNDPPSMFFKDVMKRMYKHCGCESTTYNEMVANCPKYTYKPFYSGEITDFDYDTMRAWMTTNSVTNLATVNDLGSVTGFSRIECLAPEIDPNILPFQDLEVVVSSKSAPHRFFSTPTSSSGLTESIEITDFSKLPENATGIQEGDAFQYLDSEKLFPLNADFSMNSILGQMNFNLSPAKPAKLVELEFDKLYYIATLEGYFTPCPSCAKDSWFPNFSANPLTTQGVGLQSIGYTTKRDAWGSNLTLGNYEDTIFGRACWLPPTMLPYAHDLEATAKDQRLNRLKTQAAMYANGYQRDWFGFNKGAMIGSFDGVTWFAIGKGRVVRATTNKLYLAINAPFADLSMPNDHIVSVQEYDFITTGAQFDYNPEEAINSPLQNEAGLCQRNHMCETDSDCITQLGWEYVCADVNSLQTSWPKFDPTTAQEVANDERTGALAQFLAQGQLPPGAGSKRCVYRGAGAPCRADFSQITDLEIRKSLTCAPNFYCAKTTTTNVFNKEVARFAGTLQDISEANNHYYGQEANILGRPKQYMATSTRPLYSLPTVVRNRIDKNILLTDATAATDIGLCRPGKKLPSYGNLTNDWDQVDQHKERDLEDRADYISQISSCNATLYTTMKMSSCPALDSDGNYMHLKDEYIANEYPFETSSGVTVNYTRFGITERLTQSQNSCGLEALSPDAFISTSSTVDSLRPFSAFKTIEGRSLATSDIQYEPTLVANACFRKAGAVCHTDLDCSPNIKHAELIDIINPSFFGNSAEKKYWEEYLVCGQGPREPTIPGTVEFNTYDITNNRCCREIGKNLTMYTEDSKGVTESIGLNSSKFGSFHPNDPSRYSRYNNINSSINSTDNTSNINRPTAYSTAVGGILGQAGNNILKANQWQTFKQTGEKTCCGGGWIRKFADGTNNWTVNRLNLDINNFKCLNFKSPLVTTDNPQAFGLTNAQNNQDSQNFCLNAQNNGSGCAQQYFEPITTAFELKPILDNTVTSMTLYSDPDTMKDEWVNNPWSFMPFFTTDDSVKTWLDWTLEYSDEALERRHIAVRLPSFITWADASAEIDSTASSSVEVQIEHISENQTESEYKTCQRVIPPNYSNSDPSGWYGLQSASEPSAGSSDWSVCTASAYHCCYMYEPQSRVIKVAYNYETINQTEPGTPSGAWDTQNNTAYENGDRGIRINFISPGMAAWEQKYITSQPVTDTTSSITLGGVTSEIIEHRRSASPGNALYYLNRLTKLELIGIPQITFEPLYCNDNYQKLVPGIFKTSVEGQNLTNINEFNNHSLTFLDDNSKKPFENDVIADAQLNANSINLPSVGTKELLSHEQIFSDHDFMCCAPLGSTLQEGESMTKCCSGYAVQNDGGDGAPATSTCMLAPTTNLNVYFNRFVSNEGSNSSIENPLVDSDFDPRTGAPKITATGKLRELAQQFCAGTNTYVMGGAFGPYVAQPRGNLGISGSDEENQVYSILDSQFDSGTNNDTPAGYAPFTNGFRWNNHVYCPGSSD